MYKQKNVHQKTPLVIAMASASLLLSACGGSGGADTGALLDVPGLAIPEKVNLINASEGSNDGLAGDGMAGDGMAGDAGSDYASDESRTYVYDSSMDALDQVNSILCYISQTGASSMVNAGPYVALVDEKRCSDEESSDGSEQGASGSGNAPDYAQWVVDVTRASATAPQVVRFWVPADTDGDPSDPKDNNVIMAELTINAAPTAEMPNGDFVLNYKGAFDGALVGMAGTEISLSHGTLKSVVNSGAGSQISFFNESGTHLPGLSDFGIDFASMERANVISGADGPDTGRAMTEVSESQGGNSSSALFAVDFNAAALQRGQDANDNDAIEAGELSCLSRTDFTTYGWRYNLYDATSGDRVELNSGFPFNKVNNVPTMGYVGYWGVWLDGGTSLSNGDQISRQAEAGSAEETYTVAVSEGKLSKRTLGSVEFADLVGADLSWHGDHSDPYCSSGCADQTQNVVAIDASGTVTVTHEWDESGDERELVAVDPVVDITPSNPGETLNLWSESLGGSVNYQSGATTLAAYSETFVAPNDSSLSSGLSLVCYSQCPIGGVFEPDENTSLYYSHGERKTYTLTAASGVYSLTDDSNSLAVALRSVENMGEGNEDTGLYAGPMVLPTDDPGVNDWHNIYSASTSYNWNTGPQDWNTTTTVIDADNEAVAFDQPLQFFYSYSAGDDININPALTEHPAGSTFRLSYGGDGDLWGFPNSTDPSCTMGDRCPQYPRVTLADGVTLGTSDQYIVRRIESEQHMNEDAGACGSLDAASVLADTSLALPTAVDAEVTFGISDRPDMSGATPAVIGGVVQ